MSQNLGSRAQLKLFINAKFKGSRVRFPITPIGLRLQIGQSYRNTIQKQSSGGIL